jgi:hypothetical protein
VLAVAWAQAALLGRTTKVTDSRPEPRAGSESGARKSAHIKIEARGGSSVHRLVELSRCAAK